MEDNNIKLTIKEDPVHIATKDDIITNPITLKAIEEGLELLKHPEDGAKSIEEFWSDLL